MRKQGAYFIFFAKKNKISDDVLNCNAFIYYNQMKIPGNNGKKGIHQF